MVADLPRANDPVRLFVRDTLEPGAVYGEGALQVDAAAHVGLSRAEPLVIVPPRAEQNGRTLLPENVRPMADLIRVTQAWNELAPIDTLRAIYAPESFALAARMRADGRHLVAPPAVADAVELLAGEGLLASGNGTRSGAGAGAEPGHGHGHGDLHDLAAMATGMGLGTDTGNFPAAGVIEPVALLRNPTDQRKGGARPVHLIDPTIGPLGAQARLAAQTGGAEKADPKRTYHAALNANRVRYYAADPVLDPTHAFGLRPREYPMLQRIIAESREAWLGRDAMHNAAAESMPRTAIEMVTKAFLHDARQPPDPAFSERECCAGDNCRVRQLAREEGRPAFGYCPKEFQTPVQQTAWRDRRLRGVPLATEAPAGLCYVCTSARWTDLVLNGLLHKQAPMHPVNTIQVEVGRGGYASDALLPEVVDGVKTCISGHVPFFDKAHLQFELMPDGRAILYEVNVDFHVSLSQSNTCLGVRKSRALAGASVSGMRPLTPARAAEHMRHWNSGRLPHRWVQFLCTVPLPVLADRALVDAAKEQHPTREPTRVPVLWLRQAYGLDSCDQTIPEPIARAFRERLAPLTGQQLQRHFHCDTPTALAEFLSVQLRGALTTFEDAVEYAHNHPEGVELILDLVFDPGAAAYPWARAAFGVEFAGLPTRRPDTLLWCTTVWRILVALLAQRILRPWAVAASDEEYSRYTRYFVQTHLAFLATIYTTLALARPGFDNDRGISDEWWLCYDARREAHLVEVYPQATAVVCAEELPDLSPLIFATNDSYDMPGKKSPMSQLNAVSHPYFKARHGVCQRRGFDGIITGSMLNYPSVGAALALTMRAVLLGNLPGAGAPLTLAAAIRVHGSFAGKSVPPALVAWVNAHPLVSMALLREHHFYACEANGIVDEVRSLSRSWQRFKALARQCSAQIRRYVATEVATGGLLAPLDWSVLEQKVETTSVGEVLRWHEKQKEHNVKLRKDSDVGLLLKKMRPEEKRLSRAVLAAAYDFVRADGRLEAVHICAFRAARQRQTPLDGPGGSIVRSALRTGYLKLLGMSEASFVALRDWLHLSVEYASPDNPIKNAFRIMVDTAPQDVVLLKTYLRLVEYYSSSVPFFLPEQQMRQTLLAARADLAMPDFVASAPRLGYAYYCEGCLSWATSTVEMSRELLCLPPVDMTAKKRRRRAAAAARRTAEGAVPAGGAGAGALAVDHQKKQIPPRPWPPRPCFLGDGRAASMKKVFFNPLDAKLYCNRVHGETLGNKPVDEAPATGYGKDLVLGDFEPEDAEADAEPENGEAKDVSRPLFDDMNCNKPLIAVDMVGVWKWARGRLYGLCVYCARLCEVHSVNMTNLGLSCGEHALVNEYPKYHRLWKHIIRPATREPESGAAPANQHCFICPTAEPATTEADVYDRQYMRAKIGLCDWHHHCVRALLPRAKNIVTPPVALSTLLSVASRGGTIQ